MKEFEVDKKYWKKVKEDIMLDFKCNLCGRKFPVLTLTNRGHICIECYGY